MLNLSLSECQISNQMNMQIYWGQKFFELQRGKPNAWFRGAARYISESFRECLELECMAIKRVRNDMGLRNVQIMIPFIRTLDEAKEVIELLKQNDLESGKDDLKIISDVRIAIKCGTCR